MMQEEGTPKISGHRTRYKISLFFPRTGMVLVAGGIATQGFSAITGLLIARKIGPEGYGQYATAFALVNSFVFTFLLGLDSVVVREVARSPSNAGKIISSAGFPAAVWSGGLVVFICLLGKGLDYSCDVILLVSIIALATAFKGLINLARAGLRGFEKLGLDAMMQSSEAALALVFISVLLGIHGSAFSAAWGLLLSEVAAFGLSMRLLSRVSGPIGAFSARLAKRLIKASVPIGLTFTLLGINMRVEMVVLGIYAARSEIGKYAAALSIVMLTRSLSLISSAFLPRLSASYEQGLTVFLPIFCRGFGGITIFASAAGLIIFILAEPMLLTLFGRDFIGGADVLKILAIMGAVMFVNTYLWHAMIAMNSQSRMALATLVSLVVTAGSLIYLIPKFGIAGAAVSSLGREVCQAVLLSWFVFKKLL